MKVKNVWGTYNYVGLSGLLTALRYGVQSALYRQRGRQYIRKRIYDFEMWLDVQDKGISRTLLLFGKRELEHRYILQLVLKPGMTVLDIGANIGYYVLMESGLIGNGKIIAIEPVPSNVELLKRNLKLNDVNKVTVIHGAVSDKRGVQNFHLSHRSNLGTFHVTDSGARDLSGQVIPVETQTVGEIAAEHGPPDLIRMDVEGHEVAILDSLLHDVRAGSMSPLILFETHRSAYTSENNMESTMILLFEAGYDVRYLGSSSQSGAQIIKQRGYRESISIATDFMVRSIFENIKAEDAIDFICHTGGVRTVLLAKTT
jgi:FkbM family methyltransferase